MQYDPKQLSNKHQVDIAIVYANPLKNAQIGACTPEDLLDYESQCRKIVKELKNVNKNLSVQVEIATRNNLLEIIQRGAKILQILCHVEYDKQKKDFYFIFENERGLLDQVSTSELKGVLKNQKPNIGLAIINARYSKTIVEAFYDVGITYVICVDSKNYFEEQIAQEFFQSFYKNISDEMSVDLAFSKSRESLTQIYSNCQSPELEHSEIASLSSHSKNLNQSIILEAKIGAPEIKCHDGFLTRPFAINRSIGRVSELYQLYTLLSASDSRIVVLIGNVGSGKSALVRELACYLSIRGHFQDNISIVDMEGIRTSSQLVSELILRLLDPGETGSIDELFDDLLETIKSQNTLVILEDCDSFISQNQKQFLAVLKKILENTKHVKILLTASNKINLHINEITIELTNLTLDNALNLLTEIVPSEYLAANPKKELESYSQTFALQTVFWITQQLQARRPLFEVINELKASGINSDRSIDNQICASNLESNFKMLKEINAEEYYLISFMSLYPTGLNTKELEVHARTGRITTKWSQYILASDVYSQLDSRVKMYTSSKLGIPSHLAVESSSVVVTVHLVRSSNIYSERLAEYSMICTYGFWEIPDILIKEWNHLRKQFPFSIYNPVPKLNDLRTNFEHYKLNLISIFNDHDKEALKLLLKQGDVNNEILNMIHILWIGIPTLYKIFFAAYSEEIAETALSSLQALDLSAQVFLILKAKLSLCLFGIYNNQPKKNLQKLLAVFTQLQELRRMIEDSPKLEDLKAELNFVEAYFVYRLKKNKYGSSENLPIPEEQRRYTWALKLLAQSLELLGGEDKFQFLIGRISLLQCKIYTSVKERENIPLLSMEKQLKTAIEIFEKKSNSKRLELKAYWLLARLYQKSLRERVDLKNLNLTSQQVYYQLNEIKKNLLRKDIITFLKDFGDKSYESKIKGLVKEINQNFLENFTNVVAFLKAKSLETPDSSTEIPTFFKSDLLSSVRDLNRNARLKFATLTKDSIAKTINFGCKILYIDSEIMSQKGIIVEKSDHLSEHEIISYEEFEQLLSTTPMFLKSDNISQMSAVTRSSLDPDANRLMVVILKSPPDDKMRDILLNRLMLPYLIWFEFKRISQLSNPHSKTGEEKEISISDEYHRKLFEESYREKFTLSFVEQLLLGNLAAKAFEQAKVETKEFLWKSFHFEGADFVQIESPKTITTKNKIMFSELKSLTSIEDISTPRCPTNLSKVFLPFTGRKREMKEICQALQDSVGGFVKVVGSNGVGKTRLVLETGYYLMIRNQYPDGVFYFTRCNEGSKSLATTIRKTFSPSPLELRKFDKILSSKKMLVIIDDFDENEAASVLQELINRKIHVIVVASVQKQQELKSEYFKENSSKIVSLDLLSEQQMYEIIKSYTGFIPDQLFPDINALQLIRDAWKKPKFLIDALYSQGYITSSGAVYRIKDFYSSFLKLDEWMASKSSDRSLRHEQDLNISRNSRFYQKNVKRETKERDDWLIESSEMTVTNLLEQLGVPVVKEEVIVMSDFDSQSDNSDQEIDEKEFNSDLEEDEVFVD